VVHPAVWLRPSLEDRDGSQGTPARGDRRQAATGGRAGLARPERRRRRALDRRERGDLLPLAAGVRRAQGRPGQAPEGVRDRGRPPAPGGRRPDPGPADPGGGRLGKLPSPARRRACCIAHVRHKLQASGRRSGAALGQHRSTRRKLPRGRDDEEQLTADLIGLARRYNRCGYRARSPSCPLRSTAAGWAVDGKRVERIWRRDGLKVPARQQPKRGRLWLADGSCVRLRAARASGPRLVLRLRRGSHP
jgi:hypothetical protein